jgi:GNAT superfamily N-acetyltransferase
VRSVRGYCRGEVVVRRIRPDDWETLRRLRLAALADAPEAFAARLDQSEARPDGWWQDWARRGAESDETATFLAFDGNRAVGMAGGYRSETEPSVTVVAMWVAPEGRRGGTGRELLNAVEAWATAGSAESTDLSVTDANPEAHAFYRACGYADTGWTAPLERDQSLTQIGMRKAAAAFAPDLGRWDAWTPDEVAHRFTDVEAPWCVAAGWALDLFLGGRRREHEDLEIAVPRDRFDEVADALDGFDLFVVGDGVVRPLPAARDLLEETHQTWVREPETGLWRLDVFREPCDGDTWVCRRDERIRMPYERLIEHTADGIPHMRPEVVLLFKAKHERPKDDEDLSAVLPRLDGERRRWLLDALELVHPGHRWLSVLGG